MGKRDNYLHFYAKNDEYNTSPNQKKIPFPPPFIFYSNLLKIVLHSNRLAHLGKYTDIPWSNSSVDVLEALERSGVRLHFTGMLNITKISGPMIFAANHMSTLETFVLPSIIQPVKKVIFVIKEELAKYPLFGPIAMARDPILVGRENPREDLKIVLEQGSQKLKEGKSIIIFPQKTRSIYFEPASFNSLGVKLAKRNNVPVVPIALMTDVWGNGKVIKEIGKIDISKKVEIAFGEPIIVQGNGAEEHQMVVDFIAAKFREWGKEKFIKELTFC
jgi:1-acyl-sn-glycerol-3-phosphate acyltransferase